MLCKKKKIYTPQKNQSHLEQPTFYVNTLTKMLVVLHNSSSM